MLNPFIITRNAMRRTPLRKAVMACRHWHLRDADVFLASYPRSGNTWLKSLIVSCLFGEALENFSDTVNPVIPIVGYHRRVRPLLNGSGRIIKTHEGYRPEYKRAIWIVRDPRDVVLSEFKLEVRSNRFFGSFDDYLSLFVEPPRNGRADWRSHTASWSQCSLSESDDLLSLRFEDLRENTSVELQRVLTFLGIEFDDAMIQRALEQNSLQSMATRHAAFDKTLGKSIKKNMPAVNKGVAGGWREQLSADAVAKIDATFGDVIQRMGYERCQP